MAAPSTPARTRFPHSVHTGWGFVDDRCEGSATFVDKAVVVPGSPTYCWSCPKGPSASGQATRGVIHAAPPVRSDEPQGASGLDRRSAGWPAEITSRLRRSCGRHRRRSVPSGVSLCLDNAGRRCRLRCSLTGIRARSLRFSTAPGQRRPCPTKPWPLLALRAPCRTPPSTKRPRAIRPDVHPRGIGLRAMHGFAVIRPPLMLTDRALRPVHEHLAGCGDRDTGWAAGRPRLAGGLAAARAEPSTLRA